MTITERIANRLAEIFPDAVIYSENRPSGFNVPSFYISKISTDVKNRFFDIQDRKLFFQLVYFANPEKPNADMERVEGLLLDNFRSLGDYATVRNREINLDSKEQTLTMSFEIWQNMYLVNDAQTLGRMGYSGKVTGKE